MRVLAFTRAFFRTEFASTVGMVLAGHGLHKSYSEQDWFWLAMWSALIGARLGIDWYWGAIK